MSQFDIIFRLVNWRNVISCYDLSLNVILFLRVWVGCFRKVCFRSVLYSGWLIYPESIFFISRKRIKLKDKVKLVGKIWASQVIELSKISKSSLITYSHHSKWTMMQKNTSTLEKSDVEEVVLNAVCLVSSAGKTMPLTLFLPGNALWLLWWGWPWQNDHNDPREKHTNWHEPTKKIRAHSSDNLSMCKKTAFVWTKWPTYEYFLAVVLFLFI